MKSITLISKTWKHPILGQYTKYEITESIVYLADKTFYFVTRSGEAGKLDCSINEPEGMVSIGEIFDKLFMEEYDFKGFLIHSMRQDAWRYFTDKSKNNDIWFLNHMNGSPPKENLTNKDMELSKLIKKKEITVELQDITYKKWLNFSKADQTEYMRLFLDNPVEGSAYIFNHTFHTGT